jgi:predicted metalloendopeptidase
MNLHAVKQFLSYFFPGRQYDKDGNLKQWWSDSVIKRFKEKAQCIIDQYSNYTVVEAGLNVRTPSAHTHVSFTVISRE